MEHFFHSETKNDKIKGTKTAIMSKCKDKNSIFAIFKFIFFHFSFLSLLYFPFSSSFTLSSFFFF